MTPSSSNVVIVTGLSGAGRSTVLRALEDLGYFCIDNLPTVMAPEVVSLCESGGISRIALGIDVRVRAFLNGIENVLDGLLQSSRTVDVVFCDASDEAILRRFSETRRPHALASTSAPSSAFGVLDGVRIERERLVPLRARATRVIDTTDLSVHDLRRMIFSHFNPSQSSGGKMLVRMVSFGFKYGTPVDADLVFDVRFLKNPFFVPGLRELVGTNPKVSDFVVSLPETAEFLNRTRSLLEFVLPQYEREGKSYLTVAIGCTGGKHRSVVVAEALAASLGATVVHRDIARDPLLPARASNPDALSTGQHAAVDELSVELSPLPRSLDPDSTRGGT